MVEALARLDALVPQPQPEAGMTYAAKIDKAEARIDWTRPAAEVDRLIRGLVAVPRRLVRGGGRAGEAAARRVWRRASGAPGTHLGGFRVACGSGAVEVTEAQREGKRPDAGGRGLLRGWTLPARLG